MRSAQLDPQGSFAGGASLTNFDATLDVVEVVQVPALDIERILDPVSSARGSATATATNSYHHSPALTDVMISLRLNGSSVIKSCQC